MFQVEDRNNFFLNINNNVLFTFNLISMTAYEQGVCNKLFSFACTHRYIHTSTKTHTDTDDDKWT